MKITEQDKRTLIRIIDQIPLDENSFIWYLLNIYIHVKVPRIEVLELFYTDEMNSVREALIILFELIDKNDCGQLRKV